MYLLSAFAYRCIAFSTSVNDNNSISIFLDMLAMLFLLPTENGLDQIGLLQHICLGSFQIYLLVIPYRSARTYRINHLSFLIQNNSKLLLRVCNKHL